MKKRLSIVLTTLSLTTIVLIGCNSPAKNVEVAQANVADADANLEKAKDEYLEDINKYKQESADKIEANNQSIIEFRARIDKDKKKAKKEYKEKIAALEVKNSDLKMKIENYKEDGKENWEVFKAEFSHDMDELGNAFKDFSVNNVK